MIEAIFALLAMFGDAEGEEPCVAATKLDENTQIIRALDSQELKGFDNLQAHQADEWFV
jgi:hypothetical protein